MARSQQKLKGRPVIPLNSKSQEKQRVRVRFMRVFYANSSIYVCHGESSFKHQERQVIYVALIVFEIVFLFMLVLDNIFDCISLYCYI